MKRLNNVIKHAFTNLSPSQMNHLLYPGSRVTPKMISGGIVELSIENDTGVQFGVQLDKDKLRMQGFQVAQDQDSVILVDKVSFFGDPRYKRSDEEVIAASTVNLAQVETAAFRQKQHLEGRKLELEIARARAAAKDRIESIAAQLRRQ